MHVLRADDARFRDLPGYPFEPHYIELENPEGGSLRMHYVDEGPRDAPPVWLCHGEPSWSYAYRKLIPRLVDAGLRVVVHDLIGFGRSDKPTDKTFYSFERHVGWLRQLVTTLDLREITFFGQDWGGPTGLGVLQTETDRFARIVVGNTMLHTCEPALAGRLAWSNHALEGGDVQVNASLLQWILASQRMPGMQASTAVRFATQSNVSDAELAAYDAPFPDETYKAGMRQFPALIPLTPDDPGAVLNRRTWAVLEKFELPLLTLFGDSDPGTGGWERVFQERVPGARGQAHEVFRNTGHFIQEDRGPEIAARIAAFVAGD
jgi:haloalkane dehalogenase